MAPKSPINVVFGAANIGDKTKDKMARFDTPEEVKEVLDTFYNRGYREIDTARVYSPHAPGSSEPRLGAAGAGKKFIIDTKVLSAAPGSHTKENIAKEVDISLSELKVKQFEIEFLHQPDRTVPFEETAEAIDKAYREGKFKRFGLSNYKADEVAQFVEIAERRGFVKPTVYQGQYNPIVRGGEKELFPLLRKHNIAFYAFSPAAGGFFASSYKKPVNGGRFDPSTFVGSIYSSLYLKPTIKSATDKALKAVTKHGINGHAASLRWTAFHGELSPKFGDAVIIGVSSTAQLTANLDAVEAGPLPQEVADAISAVHKEIEAAGEEVPYHF